MSAAFTPVRALVRWLDHNEAKLRANDKDALRAALRRIFVVSLDPLPIEIAAEALGYGETPE
jgi:hypothetical protein